MTRPPPAITSPPDWIANKPRPVPPTTSCPLDLQVEPVPVTVTSPACSEAPEMLSTEPSLTIPAPPGSNTNPDPTVRPPVAVNIDDEPNIHCARPPNASAAAVPVPPTNPPPVRNSAVSVSPGADSAGSKSFETSFQFAA